MARISAPGNQRLLRASEVVGLRLKQSIMIWRLRSPAIFVVGSRDGLEDHISEQRPYCRSRSAGSKLSICFFVSWSWLAPLSVQRRMCNGTGNTQPSRATIPSAQYLQAQPTTSLSVEPSPIHISTCHRRVTTHRWRHIDFRGPPSSFESLARTAEDRHHPDATTDDLTAAPLTSTLPPVFAGPGVSSATADRRTSPPNSPRGSVANHASVQPVFATSSMSRRMTPAPTIDDGIDLEPPTCHAYLSEPPSPPVDQNGFILRSRSLRYDVPILWKALVGLVRHLDHAVGLSIAEGRLVLHLLSFPLQPIQRKFSYRLDELVRRGLLGHSVGGFVGCTALDVLADFSCQTSRAFTMCGVRFIRHKIL